VPSVRPPRSAAIVFLDGHGAIEGEYRVTLSDLTSARPVPGVRRPDPILMGHLAVFAIGATSGLHLMQYAVTGLSLVCLLLVPGYLMMTHRGADLLPVVLGVVGWISFIISALVNQVSLIWPNYLGAAAFSLYLVGLTVLTGRSVDRISWALGGIALGSVIFFVIHGIELTRLGSFLFLWKYGVAPPATLVLLVVMAAAKVRIRVQVLVLLALGLFSLVQNFRSHALVCLLAGATLWIHAVFGHRIKRGWQFAGVLAFGAVFGNVMPSLARAGIFGPALKAKTLEQDTAQLPILLAGRTEPPMSITAIMEHPLLGWGSSLRLTPDFYARAEHLALRWGYEPNFPFEGYWRLPPNSFSFHSILLGSWAEGGLLAALLPAWLLLACVGLVWNFTRYGKWGPLVITLGLQTFWDLLYNPWMYNAPAVYACVALLFCARHFRGSPAST
jgi:hypothetical protein